MAFWVIDAEPAFDLVEPGRIGWGEMNVVAGTPSEPSADFGMFVSSVVIDDEMDVEVVRHTAVDLTQESEELLMTVSRFTAGDDSPRWPHREPRTEWSCRDVCNHG